MIRLNTYREPSAKAYALRLLIGPAGILDGIIETAGLGFVSARFKFEVIKRLSLLRMLAERAQGVKP